MKYLVMEIHPAYAVVLDEEGRFLKAANLRYQVGDTVQDIVELRQGRERRVLPWKGLTGAASLAACLCLVFFGWYQPNYTPYGALRMQINPDVELTLSRTDRVLELEGLNADGEALIDGYEHQGKSREEATRELVERAIEMGYLSDGETVSITVTSADAGWQAREEQDARAELEERYGETIVIQIGPDSEGPPDAEVVIPVPQPEQKPAPEPDPTSPVPPAGLEDTGYGAASEVTGGDDDTDYGPNTGGITDYDDTAPALDGVTDYEAPTDEPYHDGVTDYEDRDDDVGDGDGEDGREEPEDDGDDAGDDDDDDEDDREEQVDYD